MGTAEWTFTMEGGGLPAAGQSSSKRACNRTATVARTLRQIRCATSRRIAQQVDEGTSPCAPYEESL
jgi:hypothetical protein